jgi:hypothetical protein
MANGNTAALPLEVQIQLILISIVGQLSAFVIVLGQHYRQPPAELRGG